LAGMLAGLNEVRPDELRWDETRWDDARLVISTGL